MAQILDMFGHEIERDQWREQVIGHLVRMQRELDSLREENASLREEAESAFKGVEKELDALAAKISKRKWRFF